MRKLISIAGTVAILIAAFIVIERAMPQSTKPKIMWSSSNVYAGITGTTTVTRTITFTSDQALQGAVLEAVPQIAGFVQIQPGTFTQVPTATPQTVQLTFSAPAGAQFGAYDGTIHLRMGSSTLPQTLKTAVTYAVVPLPPDPGDAGKTTLQGIDSDGDGVRDDVERYIALSYPYSAKIRAALTQEAKGTQQMVLSTSGKAPALAASNSELDAGECAMALLGTRPESQLYTLLRPVILNTADRSSAYLTADSLTSGSFYRPAPNPLSLCQFDPNALPN